MVKLSNILNRLNPAKILVIGDMLLDTYTFGKVRRISPEAPVPVVNVQREEHRPGGAGNVVLNLLSLGAQVLPIGRIGNDWAGLMLTDIFEQEGVDASMILAQTEYATAVKNRVIADNQQIVRVDHEESTPLSEALEKAILEKLPFVFGDVKITAISDYGKGFLSPTLLAAVIEESNRRGIPVITDPKGRDFTRYKGTTVIKPNLSEAYAAANLSSNDSLEKVAAAVLHQCQAKHLLLTRSEAGISIFDHTGRRSDFPVHVREVKDVTGAGDTVLAMLAHALANDLSYDEAAQLCNVAAGIAIEQVGCARITLSDLALRLFEYNMGQKIFDREHLFILQEVLKRKPFRLLHLSNVNELTYDLFRLIQKNSEEGESLLVYVEQTKNNGPLVDMLASLKEVNFVVQHLDSLNHLCQCAAPGATTRYDGQLLIPVSS